LDVCDFLHDLGFCDFLGDFLGSVEIQSGSGYGREKLLVGQEDAGCAFYGGPRLHRREGTSDGARL